MVKIYLLHSDFSTENTSSENFNNSNISIISWNLQTFFDSVTQGSEYDEFKGEKSTWTKEKYNDTIEVHDGEVLFFDFQSIYSRNGKKRIGMT